MKKVLVVGYKGNMGRRYTTILNHLGVEWSGVDYSNRQGDEKGIDGIIVATPTRSHERVLTGLIGVYDAPVLCEKPMGRCGVFGPPKIDKLQDFIETSGLNIRMVNQYQYMPGADEADATGKTYYNYFKTGQDGLAWDCINIIGMAKGEVQLKNDSPIWDCWINGKDLNIADMDFAYIEMVKDWIKNPTNNHDYILKAHQKVISWMETST